VIPRRLILSLLGSSIVLPLALVLVLGLGRLLGKMGDEAGAAVLDRVALALGLLWTLGLICLLLSVAIATLTAPDEPEEGP
jgi:hypothetical protein